MATGGRRPEYSETLGVLINDWEQSLDRQHRLQRDTLETAFTALKRKETDPDKLWAMIMDLLGVVYQLEGHTRHDKKLCGVVTDIVGPPNKRRPSLEEIEQRLAAFDSDED